MAVSFLNKGLLLKIASPLTFISGLFSLYPLREEYRIIVNYNGQADLLLSLQIPPDYYPLQFKKPGPNNHLTNIDQHLVSNAYTSPEKNLLAESLQSRISGLMSGIREYGPGLWDKTMYNDGLEMRNDQFWSSKKTDLLILEQFIVDEHRNISDAYEFLPRHKTLLITNHRAARDPYTIFSRGVFQCLSDPNVCSGRVRKIASELRNYLDNYRKVNVDALYRTGRYMEFWNDLLEKSRGKLELEEHAQDPLIFDFEGTNDLKLSEEFLHLIFSEEQKKTLEEWDPDWKPHYLSKAHHPVLEQQQMPGDIPISEGSQKDPMVYLLQFALLLDEYSKTEEFRSSFINDFRKNAISNSLSNALRISKNFRERTRNIREYFREIGVVDRNFNPEGGIFSNESSKTFSIVSFSPKTFGSGEATVHSMSQYPFIYRDIGLKQPLPTSLDHPDSFALNDGGWLWSLGNHNVDPSKLLRFRGSSDKVLVLSDREDWSLLWSNSDHILMALGTLLKNGPRNLNFSKASPMVWGDHGLWSEGIRSPIALNLLLDELVEMFGREYDGGIKCPQKYSKSMDWGDYWNENFLEGGNK